MKQLQKKYFWFYYHTESRTKLFANLFIIGLVILAFVNSLLDGTFLALFIALFVAGVWYLGSWLNKTWAVLLKEWRAAKNEQ